ncbi:hypothetical protein [Flavobacterium sp. 1355]|jgi:hypothetical protein|uniref:hypothetical protein n=1 Tax=Flavobacterium sp. 1355 TaxID=2806571 RepID=UPI001AE268D6|nr:hypothetical protein [Flavobacterium sp. 1355]MBP1223020.1 hypothetical protein [Flavobacterium sp. 1355]
MPGLGLHEKIICILAENYNKIYSLEKLTNMVFPLSELTHAESYIAAERENQAMVLDALLFLFENGQIFLDPITDESSMRR